VRPKRFLKCTPHLPVKNLQQTLDYYRDKLGFENAWTFGDRDGGIQRDDLKFLFGENPALVEKMNGGAQRMPLIWFVDDIDEIYHEYQQRGVEISDPLRAHSYGKREFAFVDINGYYIRISDANDSNEKSR
jgi:uncharacterized glyoxalase superfamily protein PhnB